MPDLVDEEIDRLLRRPQTHVEIEREDDARAPVHAPEERAHALLWRLVESEFVQRELPVERPALAEERTAAAEVRPIALIALAEVPDQVVAGNHLVKRRRVREPRIVAAH